MTKRGENAKTIWYVRKFHVRAYLQGKVDEENNNIHTAHAQLLSFAMLGAQQCVQGWMDMIA